MKGELRSRILLIRDQMPASLRSLKDTRIRENLFSLPEFLSARIIILYASFRSEVATHGLIGESLSMGKKVLLPKVNANNARLDLYEISDIGELSPGYMGILEPDLTDERRRTIDDADLAIVPGAVFDFSGNRLGYGAGYYDGLLSQGMKKIPIIALAYHEQLIDTIPAEEHDVKVDVIVTDERVVHVP